MLRSGWLAAAGVMAVLVHSACMVTSGPASTFDRTLKVEDMVRLEVTSGSGDIVIRQGSPGTVHVHGEVRAGGFWGESQGRRAREIAASPPIDQMGSMIRLGGSRSASPFQNVRISYTIETPADTQVIARSSSGNVDISGLSDPVNVTAGSGRVRLDQIKDSVNITSSSGDIRASRIEGSVSFTTSSGSGVFSEIHEDVRGGTGSGSIEIDRALGRVNVHTGSGRVRVNGAVDDVRAGTGSGSIEIRGNPTSDSFWDLGTASGEISLTVPGNAGFALSARTSSGSFKVEMPISIEEQSRKALRAQVGDGHAHVNLETKSGNIRIQQGAT
jgi:hypothetical protein